MTILVTGSTGHTGREVVRLLAGRGAEVRALTLGLEQGEGAIADALGASDAARAARKSDSRVNDPAVAARLAAAAQVGTPQEILADPADDFVAAFCTLLVIALWRY